MTPCLVWCFLAASCSTSVLGEVRGRAISRCCKSSGQRVNVCILFLYFVAFSFFLSLFNIFVFSRMDVYMYNTHHIILTQILLYSCLAFVSSIGGVIVSLLLPLSQQTNLSCSCVILLLPYVFLIFSFLLLFFSILTLLLRS